MNEHSRLLLQDLENPLLVLSASLTEAQRDLRSRLGWPLMYFLTRPQLEALSPGVRLAIELEYQNYRDARQASRTYRQSDAQFDRNRDLDERGLTSRDAFNEENPRQSGGDRV